LLRYPGEPADPDGSPGTVVVLSASPRYLAYRLFTMWAGLLVAFAVEHTLLHSALKGPSPFGATLAVFAVLVGIPGSILTFLAYAEYSVRSYKLSDRALRIREGLLVVRETTMTFANIQNVSVSRGPVQGLFGISDVVLKTAGGGSERRKGLAPDLHVAHFHGLTNADEVRDLVLDLLRKAKSAGLGDADDAPPPSAAQTIDAAVAELRAAATSFRETAERLV
jgi:membrane protein YdbS with pleckstrin-like domain